MPLFNIPRDNQADTLTRQALAQFSRPNEALIVAPISTDDKQRLILDVAGPLIVTNDQLTVSVTAPITITASKLALSIDSTLQVVANKLGVVSSTSAHVNSSGSTPAVTIVGNTVGATTVTITGTDASGLILLDAGFKGTLKAGNACTVTFATAYLAAPPVTLTNQPAGGAVNLSVAQATTLFIVTLDVVPAVQKLSVNYHAIGAPN